MSLKHKLPLLRNKDEEADGVIKRMRLARLNDFLSEQKTTNRDEATLMKTSEMGEIDEMFKVDLNDSIKRQQFIDLLKMELEFRNESFRELLNISINDQSVRFHLVVKEPKDSFDKKLKSYLEKILDKRGIQLQSLRQHKKENEKLVSYRFPEIVLSSLNQLKDIIDEFASLNANELEQFDYSIYENGIEIPLFDGIWENVDLTSIDRLLIQPNGKEPYHVTYQVIREIEEPLKELPSFVIPTFAQIQNHRVYLTGKGRSCNIWLIRCDLMENQKVVVCGTGMAHFKEWNAAISWQDKKSKLNYQCWGCGDKNQKKWTSIGCLTFDANRRLVVVKKTPKFPGSAEEIVTIDLRDPSEPINNNETKEIEQLNPLVELTLREWGYLNQHTKFIQKGRTDNTFLFGLNCNRCVIDKSEHLENGSRFLVSWIKSGKVKIKCCSKSCVRNGNNFVHIGFIVLTNDMKSLIRCEKVNQSTDQPTSEHTEIIDSTEEERLLFDEKKLLKLAKSNSTKEEALNYINKYFAICKDDKKLYCRDNPKLEWKPFTIELVEKTYQSIRTLDDVAIFSLWKKWENARFASHVIFYPGPMNDKNLLNTFVGFGVKPSKLTRKELDSVVAPWVNHVIDILANTDQALGNYIINFLARIIQKPWEKGIVSLIFKSEHGAGKNIVFKPMEKILDDYFLLLRNIETSFNRFTSRFEKTLLCIFDEAKCYNKAAIASIKSFITSEKAEIEKKYIDAKYTENYTNFVFLSNEDWVMDIESTERRFLVVECNNKYAGRHDIETKRYMDSVRNTPPENLLQYLLERDLTNFDLVVNVPETDASIDQKVKSLSDSVDRWVYQFLTENKDQPQHSWFSNQIDAKSVKLEYHNYMKDEDRVGGKPVSFLWKRLDRFDIIKSHTYKGGQQGYFVTFPDLITLQKKFAHVCFKLKNHKIVFPN